MDSRNPGRRARPGDAFAIPDLMIARAWAEYHGLELKVELDRCIAGVEPEEALAFHRPGHLVPRWVIWHSDEHVVVLPDFGPALCFASLPEALEGVGVDEMLRPV